LPKKKPRLNFNVLIQYLDFLVKQGLIEERTVKRNNVVCACTARRIEVLKSFRELNQALPIIEGEKKNLPVAY
jgi:predicted transcriptional regulator